MKIKVYVSWREEEVLTEKQREEKVKEWKASETNFEDFKAEWLNDKLETYVEEHYRYKEPYVAIFDLSDEERKAIIEELYKNYEEAVIDDFDREYEEFESEV